MGFRNRVLQKARKEARDDFDRHLSESIKNPSFSGFRSPSIRVKRLTDELHGYRDVTISKLIKIIFKVYFKGHQSHYCDIIENELFDKLQSIKTEDSDE